MTDHPKRMNLGYSLKNIPIPTDKEYTKRLIEKVESVIKRMRWRAFFFLKGMDDTEPTDESDNLRFGFKSKRCPPKVEELCAFEADLASMIENIVFRPVTDKFQNKLQKDIRRIKNMEEVIIRADKTRNLYAVTKVQHDKLLHDNVTKHYKAAPKSLQSEINMEAKAIAKRLKLDDRMETLARSEAFLTLKDHKENFENTLPCRLINPAKPEMGLVSKQILEKIVSTVREKTKINLWKNTAAVIDWFKRIEEKDRHTFLSFDIVEFYPSISEKLLLDALNFAQQHVEITDDEMEVILHSRKSLLFANGKTWRKREKDSLFDVTMGSYDGAEVCELVGAFLLNELAECNDSKSMGLYRDDGLAALKDAPGHDADLARKKTLQVFKQHGLRITINTNLKIVNFLDATFDLNNGKYYPFRKPNDQPLYINRLSNHQPNILKNIPLAISKRVSSISSDRQVFSEAKYAYEEALAASGFKDQLEYTPQEQTPGEKRKRKRQRRIIWFNPPFSKNVATNVGRRFLQLMKKHFPPKSRLSKIFNNNTLKVSYSCMSNMGSIIRSHNRKLLRDEEPDKPCNCNDKANCPLDGKCRSECIVYKATIESETEGTKEYIGLSEPPFKARYNNHLTSFRHSKHENNTELAKHVWSLKRNEEEPKVRWSIADRAHGYTNESKRCNLCLAEKYHIITADPAKRLNKRAELVSKCRHANKFCLSNYHPP